MKRIYVTLDTEMDNDEHWGKHYPPEYSSVTEGISKMLRSIWDKYQVHPVYFVSPEVLYDERCVDVLKDEVKKVLRLEHIFILNIFIPIGYGGKKLSMKPQNILVLIILMKWKRKS